MADSIRIKSIPLTVGEHQFLLHFGGTLHKDEAGRFYHTYGDTDIRDILAAHPITKPFTSRSEAFAWYAEAFDGR